MQLHICHTTRYRYTQALRHTVQTVHLWPMQGPWQNVQEWRIKSVLGLAQRRDAWGNWVHHGSWAMDPLSSQLLYDLDIVATGVVTTTGIAQWSEPQTAPHPALCLRTSPMAEPHPRMTRWAKAVLGDAHPNLGGLDEEATTNAVLILAQAVEQKVRYRKGSTAVDTSALEAFDWGLGVCQDQAHVMVAICRSLGLPARYVSGYFFAADEPDLASHAWVDVCINPERRTWLSVDVTHACTTDTRHVRVATGLDYSTCAPVKGLRRGGGTETMHVEIQIQQSRCPAQA